MRIVVEASQSIAASYSNHLRGDRRIVSCERSGAPNSEDGGEDDDDDDDDDDGKH